MLWVKHVPWLKGDSSDAADLMTWGVKRSVFAALPYGVQARFLLLPAAASCCLKTGACFVPLSVIRATLRVSKVCTARMLGLLALWPPSTVCQRPDEQLL